MARVSPLCVCLASLRYSDKSNFLNVRLMIRPCTVYGRNNDGWMDEGIGEKKRSLQFQIHPWDGGTNPPVNFLKTRPRVKNFSSPLVAGMNCVFWWDSSFSLSLWLIYFFATSLTVKFPSFLCEADWLTRLVSLLRLLSPNQLVKQLQLELSSATAENFHLASRI